MFCQLYRSPKETLQGKYGVDNIFQLENIKDKIRDIFEGNGKWIKYDQHKESYENYYKIVCSLTKKNKQELFENWDGIDYYDDENIKNNLNLHSNDKKYPTIDHKISIKHGFLNNILPEKIANIENLCLTKKTINSSKGHLIEKEFKYKKKG